MIIVKLEKYKIERQNKKKAFDKKRIKFKKIK